MSSIKLVLLGFLRHTIGLIGLWLVGRGYLAPDQQAPWVGKAVEEAFGAIMVGGAYVWSAIDKQQVVAWLRKALHMNPPASRAAANEAAAAKKISPLVTSPGKVTLPAALLGLLLLGCGTFLHSTAGDTTTVYRSADRARTVLTATQTLRYHAGEIVAKAYVQGRISKEQAKKYEAIDDRFRAAWESASELVTLWMNAKGEAPPHLQERMADVENFTAQVESEARRVE
jgi:hypothetical protein